MKPPAPLLALILGGCILIAVGGITLFGWVAFGDHSEIALHRPSVDWLPPTASDISYYRNSNIANSQTYEFRISRTDFEALARERGWSVKPTESEVRLPRFTFYLPKGHPQRTEPFFIVQSRGLYYENRRPNGGGISVLYDLATSTAYVSKSNR